MVYDVFDRKFFYIFTCILFFGQTFFLKPSSFDRNEYISPPIEIKYLTLGFSKQFSDSFWLRAIQDFDYCENKLNEGACASNSWLFNTINLTVELDSKFEEAYFYGALALTILISDYAGASAIFDKGTQVFNKSWPLLYAAGYHALFEEKNKLKASGLYLKAADSGAPPWVRLMAGRLATEGGDSIAAKDVLKQLVERESDPRWIDKLQKKIQQLDKSTN